MRANNFVPVIILAVLCIFVPAVPAGADLLTFETTPGGAIPVDNADLVNPYPIPGGTVRFFFDLNGNNAFEPATDNLPKFEQVGNDGANGFASAFNGVPDTARPGFESQLGQYFLRKQSDSTGPIGGPFIAVFDTNMPITELSGEVWDIDGETSLGTEQWRVDVLSQTDQILDTLLSPVGTSPLPSSLDSLPWTFHFQDLPDGVAKLRLTFVGTKTDGIGLAFNNFSAVPEPSTWVLLATAGAMLSAGRRFRTRPVTSR